MDLRSTLKLVHRLFEDSGIDHALIGGLGLACYGSTRATIDLDLLILESNKERAKKLLLDNGFQLVNESPEVLQFSGIGYVDLLIARRPISQEILKLSKENGPEGINFVRAEDLIGLKNGRSLMKSEKTLNLDSYFEFLSEYFSLFDFSKLRRKKIEGKNFKL